MKSGTTAPVYEARTIKRERRTKDRVEQLDRQIIDALQKDHPQSVRHLFYLQTNPRLPESVKKDDLGYRQVQHRCVELRRSGQIPYAWIADMSRRGYFTDTFSDGSDFIRRVAGLYRSDLWAHSGYHVEVWVESRSIASVVLADCKELAVDLYPCGGFSSISFVHEAAEEHNNTDDEKPLVVLFVGDFDPAGVLIDEALERELRLHLYTRELIFRRIGITEEQIAEYDLPGKPRKETDRRALHVKETVEAEAMPASVLRALLRAEIESYLPEHALAVTKIAEQAEREHIERMAIVFKRGPRA